MCIRDRAQGTALKMGLTDKDFEDLQAVEGIAGASPTVSAHLDIAQNGVVKENVSIQGKNELYFARNPDAVKAGRGLNILDVENKNRVCLISETLENDLFDSESAVGHTLRLGGIAYTIVGVTASSTDMTSMLMGTGDGIIVPYKNAMSLAGVSHIMAVEMYMAVSYTHLRPQCLPSPSAQCTAPLGTCRGRGCSRRTG